MSTRDGAESRDRTGRLVPEPVVPPMTFIVRVSGTADDRISGIVEHPGTGRKERFDGLDALGPVIAALRVEVGGPQMAIGAAGPPARSTDGDGPIRPPP
jgi:hypothetical protein